VDGADALSVAAIVAGAAVAVAGKLRRGADALLREWAAPLLRA